MKHFLLSAVAMLLAAASSAQVFFDPAGNTLFEATEGLRVEGNLFAGETLPSTCAAATGFANGRARDLFIELDSASAPTSAELHACNAAGSWVRVASGAPSGGATALPSCAAGQIAAWNATASAWRCAAPPAAWATTSADQPSADGQVLLRDGGNVEWDTIGTDSIASWAVTGAKIPDDAIAVRHLAPALSERTLPGGGTAGQVLAKSSATAYDAAWTTRAIPTLRTAAQTRDLLATLSGTARLPATAIKDLPSGGSGLTQSQVDARILPQARAGDTTRWGEPKLPAKLDDFLDALSVAGWTDEPAGAATSAYVTLTTVARPSNPENFPGYTNLLSGPRRTNVYGLIRRPDALALSELRFAVGSVEGGDQQLLPSSGWTFLEHVAGFSYYTTPLIADLPVTNARVQRYSPFALNHVRLGIGEFTAADETKLDSISAGAEVNPRLATAAEVDAGTSQAGRTYSPALVQRQIDGRLAAPADPADDGKVATAAGGGVVWQRPRSPHVTELIDGAGPGISVPLSSADHRTALSLFSPAFDLDDADKRSGLIAVEVTFTLSGRSSNSIGFDQSLSPAVVQRLTGFVSASDLRSAAAWSSSRAEGEEVDGIDISLGSTKLGNVALWLGKNAESEAGVYGEYVGASGQNQTFAIGARVFAEFIPGVSTAAPASERSFSLRARPGSAVTISTSATAGEASAWTTLASTSAISAAQAGEVDLSAHANPYALTGSNGGGDRVWCDLRIVRTRASVVSQIAIVRGIYVRNQSQANVGSAGANAASRYGSGAVDWGDAAAAGDVYRAQARCSSQVGTRQVRFAADEAGVKVNGI